MRNSFRSTAAPVIPLDAAEWESRGNALPVARQTAAERRAEAELAREVRVAAHQASLTTRGVTQSVWITAMTDGIEDGDHGLRTYSNDSRDADTKVYSRESLLKLWTACVTTGGYVNPNPERQYATAFVMQLGGVSTEIEWTQSALQLMSYLLVSPNVRRLPRIRTAAEAHTEVNLEF